MPQTFYRNWSYKELQRYRIELIELISTIPRCFYFPESLLFHKSWGMIVLNVERLLKNSNYL